MDSLNIQEKIKHYEYFIEDTLKFDLKEIEKALDKKVTEHSEWRELKTMTNIITEFKENQDDNLLVRVDIGKGISVNGKIDDYEQLYVDIGLGIILEMDCDEASKYSDIRLKLLEKEISHFRTLAIDVKVHIKMVLLAISELQKSAKIL